MSIVDDLLCDEEWRRFKDYKLNGDHLTAQQKKELCDFVDNRRYMAAAVRLADGGFFGIPQKILVNKSNSVKKRTVYSFSPEENYIQKFIAFRLLDYDCIFSANLYSFRRDMGVKKAVTRLMRHPDINNMHSYKLDISDYFNSVSPDLILPMLKEVLAGDKKLYCLLEAMLTEPCAAYEDGIVAAKKGILAGSPISGFLANLYLSELDAEFEKSGALYARYSDDIIFFADNETELNEYIRKVSAFLSEKKLEVNPKKICRTLPREEWTFLGFSFRDSTVDISRVSKQKLKMKLRRKARALYRWKIRKGASDERAVRAFIRHFNKKFYSNDMPNEITWCRWYFPIITTDAGLKEIDAYMQQCMRFIATGKQNKSQYNFRYSEMKSLGYRTLVNSYYDFKSRGAHQNV
ncbi:MAG: hypothetical protein IJT03_01560 [Clostridia bacterium]|nr:hypothetical protein [Clostridia bacterium]